MLLLFALPSLPVLLVYIAAIGIALAVVYYIINRLFPEPFRGWAIVVVVVIGGILLIWLLLSMVGATGSFRL